MTRTVSTFPHRQNKQGEYESICRSCFATIATAESEAELIAHERAHVCDFLWAYKTSQELRLVSGVPLDSTFLRSARGAF